MLKWVQTDDNKKSTPSVERSRRPCTPPFARKVDLNDNLNILSKHVALPKPPITAAVRSNTSTISLQIEKYTRIRKENVEKLEAGSDDTESILSNLCIINSDMQQLRKQRSKVKSSFKSNEEMLNKNKCLPFIAPSLKEMDEIEFNEAFTAFLSNHYYEEVNNFEDEIYQLSEMRLACSEVLPDDLGLNCLFTYYNQLHFIGKRFYNNTSQGNILFKWFDSYTGIPVSQSSLSYEKACLLFNIAVLYAEIAISLRYNDVEKSVEMFQQSAGAFRQLRNQFKNAPSRDLNPATLQMLEQLMLLQAHETFLDHYNTKRDIIDDVDLLFKFSQYMAFLSDGYTRLCTMASGMAHLPAYWANLFECKQLHYSATSHRQMGDVLHFIHCSSNLPHQSLALLLLLERSFTNLYTFDARGMKTAALWHMRHAIVLCESASNVAKRQASLQLVIQHALNTNTDITLKKFSDLEEEDVFNDINKPADILGKSLIEMNPIPPDFAKYKIADIFQKLGPLSVFCAQKTFSKPRTVIFNPQQQIYQPFDYALVQQPHPVRSPNLNIPQPLDPPKQRDKAPSVQSTRDLDQRGSSASLGFSICCEAPVIVATVESLSRSEKCGLKPGDVIIQVNGLDVRWDDHKKVADLIRRNKNDLTLLITTLLESTSDQVASTDVTNDSPVNDASFKNNLIPPTNNSFSDRNRFKNSSQSIFSPGSSITLPKSSFKNSPLSLPPKRRQMPLVLSKNISGSKNSLRDHQERLNGAFQKLKQSMTKKEKDPIRKRSKSNTSRYSMDNMEVVNQFIIVENNY